MQAPTMTVIVDGKKEQRDVDYMEREGGRPRWVPVLKPGEHVMYGVDGSVVIARGIEK